MRTVAAVLALLLIAAPSIGQKNKHSEEFRQAQAIEENSGGNAAAEFVLGDSYEHGTGVPQDYAEALRWYLKSANRGYAAAQVPLAWLYFGHGPSKCSAEELQALDRAFSAGNITADSAERFSFCTSDSDNLDQAYFWVDVALASDQSLKEGGLSKDSRGRALLLKKMLEGGVLHGPAADHSLQGMLSQDRIAAAQARATKWFADHQSKVSQK